MHSVSTRVLSLAGEAALLVRGGRIVYANARAEKLLGGELLGKPLTALFPRRSPRRRRASSPPTRPYAESR